MQRTKQDNDYPAPSTSLKPMTVKTLWGKTSAIRKKKCRHQQYQSQIKSNQVKHQTEIKTETPIQTKFSVPLLFIRACYFRSSIPSPMRSDRTTSCRCSCDGCFSKPVSRNRCSHRSAASGFVSRSAGFTAEVTYRNLTNPRCYSS